MSLCYGGFRNAMITNHQCIIERAIDGERILICINAGDYEYYANPGFGNVSATDLLDGNTYDLSNGIALKPYSSYILKIQ